MLKKIGSRSYGGILLLAIIFSVLLYGCKDNGSRINDNTGNDYEMQIESLTIRVQELEHLNALLMEEKENFLKNQSMIKEQSDQSKSKNQASEKFSSYEAFKIALEQADLSYADLIDFYYGDIGDGAYGQDYSKRVLDYFFELDIDDFLVISRKLNDRFIDNFAYNFSEVMLNEYSMSEGYLDMRLGVQSVLLNKLEDSTITSEDRQLIHALLSHWYRND